MKKTLLIVSILSLFALTGCTENQRARHYGGTATVNLPKNKAFVNATWKEGNDLWYIVRDRKEGEKPQTYEFVEDSSIGLLNGKVVFVEN